MPDARYSKPSSLLGHLVDGMLVRTFRSVNRHRPWHKIGKWLGLANLLALRIELRRHNLHDTDSDLTGPKRGCPFHFGPNATRKRTEEGTHNDLANPAMGCRFSRLGRNMRSLLPLAQVPGDLDPNPFEISEKILRRQPGKFISAESLNLLAAAWIQFQVHDWFGHENEVLTANDADPANQGKTITVPPAGNWKHPAMVIPKTKPDDDNWPDPAQWPAAPSPLRPPPLNSRHPAFRNKNPQWWDGSQIYGETLVETLRLRTDPASGALCPQGQLYIDPQGFLPVDQETKIPLTGFNDNWWLGLEILHTLFAKEHNSICAALAQKEPYLTDQEIFETARLINCAIMAKIHTVEWTPGIIAHPSIQPALDANWMGLYGHFFGEKRARALAAWLPNGVIKDILTGVPMSETDHHGAPYSLTEEFNAVYRLHPLIPDEVKIKLCGTKTELGTYSMLDIAFTNARQPFGHGVTMDDVLYTFGTSNPGAVVAQNYPDFLRDLALPVDPATGRRQVLDLAAVDLIRDRERGVPRYCEFRRQLRMSVPTTWKEMAGAFDGSNKNLPDLTETLKTIYKGNLEAVDTMVGMFLEVPPEKFGFSDTAFRIFILMASRRLKSDRFFTEDYTAEFYTQTGLDWIAATGMKEVILRHHPALATVFKPGVNPFAPW